MTNPKTLLKSWKNSDDWNFRQVIDWAEYANEAMKRLIKENEHLKEQLLKHETKNT